VTFATQSSPLSGRVPAVFGLFLVATSSPPPADGQTTTRKPVETPYAQVNGVARCVARWATVTVRRTSGECIATFEG
jgi:hypothetical protein